MSVNGAVRDLPGGEGKAAKRSGLSAEVGGREAYGTCENAACGAKASVTVELDTVRLEFCWGCWVLLYGLLFSGRKHRVERER